MSLVASLPMYDWPEVRAQVDAEWAAIREGLRAAGIDAPERLARERTDLHALWRDPDLLLSQTCWGPMELGLAAHVQVVAQPDYSAFEGGEGELYSSAVVMRPKPGEFDESRPTLPPSVLPDISPTRGEIGQSPMSKLLISPLVGEMSGRTEGGATGRDIPVISDILIDQLQSTRFAFNSLDSRSGYLGLKADLEARGAGVSIFSELVETGGHRASIKAVAEGRADVAAIDCKTWHLAKIYEPAARELVVVGWTSMRLGLPFITARGTSDATLAALREGLAAFSPP